MIDVALIVGSTRPGRNAEAVANWIHDIARKRSDARFELVDIQDFNLPLLDEAAAALWGNYAQPHTKAWAAKIDAFDAFVFVTPEYNHGPSGALKNAIDFLYREWNNKAAGFVGYGGAGGSRAVEQLRLVMAELQVATVRAQVGLSLYTDFENFTAFKPAPRKETTVTPMLDQLVEPADVTAIVASYGKWLSQSAIPKLLILGDPGAIMTGRTREFCQAWPNQREVTVRGRHFLQEDSPHQIGPALAEFVTSLRA